MGYWERGTHIEGRENKPRRWRLTKRRVWWAFALLVSLVVTTLLIANLYSGVWKALAEERVATVIGIGVGLTLIIVLLAIGGASIGWTGFRGKTLWHWQELLFVPLTIALLVSLFTQYQAFHQQQVENQRAEEARQLATASAQRTMLQAYLEHMGKLLLENDLRDKEDENSDVRLLARARTLAVLNALNGDREARVLEFLNETDLIQFGDQDQAPIISLRFANLYKAPLRNRHILSNTDLDRAELIDANLFNAKLINADLSRADLRQADLRQADLQGANLRGADLSKAIGVTCQQTKQAESLEGATMPDGQLYEDWVKDKEDCEEDEENDGPS